MTIEIIAKRKLIYIRSTMPQEKKLKEKEEKTGAKKVQSVQEEETPRVREYR